MRRGMLGGAPRFGLCSAVVLASIAAPPASAAVDVRTIVDRWTAANHADVAGASLFDYDERVRDDDGTRTYEITFRHDVPYKRLIVKDGRAVTGDPWRRIDDYQKSRERIDRILAEMPRAFQYTLQSSRQEHSRRVYVLTATPRSDYVPTSVEGQVLMGMRGEFWIDQRTYQLVRGSARVLRPVSIDGFLARIQPGTEFDVEQAPVGAGVWLPTHIAIHSHSSIVFLFHHHSSEDRTYFHYRLHR